MGLGPLVVYRSGGLGDFVKTWPTLRQHAGTTTVIDQERGALTNAILGIQFRDIKQWQPCFSGRAGPPDYAERYDRIRIYRHEFYSSEDDNLGRNIRTVAANCNIEFSSFSPGCCGGKSPSPNFHSFRGPLFHVGAGRLLFGKDNVPPNYPSKAWDINRSIAFAKELQER